MRVKIITAALVFGALACQLADAAKQPDEELKRADEAGDEFIRQMHHTLDIKPVLKERLSAQALPKYGASFYGSEDLHVPDADRFLYAMEALNTVYLTSAYVLTKCPAESEALRVQAIRSLLPPNAMPAFDEFEAFVLRPPVRTPAQELAATRQMTADLQAVNDLLRKRIAPNWRDCPHYARAIKGNAPAQVFRPEELNGAPVYMVTKEILVFYMVEEEGKFKILNMGFNWPF